MILRIIIIQTILLWVPGVILESLVPGVILESFEVERPSSCLTGSTRDVQSWVADDGRIIASNRRSVIDLSSRDHPTIELRQQFVLFNSSQTRTVKYLGLAGCGLTTVPLIFHLEDRQGRALGDTLEYLTLYDNKFFYHGAPGFSYGQFMNATEAHELNFETQFKTQAESTWDLGFRGIIFSNLRELDLRSCAIAYLNNEIFKGMPSLQSLYLSGNYIGFIHSRAFNNLKNLIHLDLSSNYVEDENGNEIEVTWGSFDVFRCLPRLASLDLSFTRIGSRNANILRSLGRNFQRLSLCYTDVRHLGSHIFNGTSLKYLDVSGNSQILNNPRSLSGVQEKLKAVYAENIGLQVIEPFDNCTNLEVLKVSNNEITKVLPKVAEKLKSLKIFDLDNNRLTDWTENTFSLMPNLQLLSLRNNNLNIINSIMLQDIENITYVGLSSNNFICNCLAREFFEIAAKNENNLQSSINGSNDFISERNVSKNVADFHTGFNDYFTEITDRNVVNFNCNQTSHNESVCETDAYPLEFDGNFILFDYTADEYRCLVIDNGQHIPFHEIVPCHQTKRDYNVVIEDSWKKLIAIIIIGVVSVSVLIIGIMFRRNFRYFFITVKNSALLSMIDKQDGCEDVIFNYDVFVSYCNEDRSWVLDHLLPHVEKDCSVSVCLHERDFQVGLSILENIVSCMDRSRCIMLVISQRFLLSQWCQFEMHLAQHRLLETRREDLILILLEDIPRRLRPNTLHYLMLTKTYCQWSKDETEQTMFWKRLKKCIVTHKLKDTENFSLA